jgi:hypothetical protein
MCKPPQHPIDGDSGADSDSSNQYEAEMRSQSSNQGSAVEEHEVSSDEDAEQVSLSPF